MTAKSRKANWLFLVSFLVIVVFHSTVFLCSMKIWTSFVVISVQMPSMYLNESDRAVPWKEQRACFYIASAYEVRDTLESMAKLIQKLAQKWAFGSWCCLIAPASQCWPQYSSHKGYFYFISCQLKFCDVEVKSINRYFYGLV